jgi:hypothetical protein
VVIFPALIVIYQVILINLQNNILEDVAYKSDVKKPMIFKENLIGDHFFEDANGHIQAR